MPLPPLSSPKSAIHFPGDVGAAPTSAGTSSQTVYTLAFAIHPSTCVVRVGLRNYRSGATNTSMAAGVHAITAVSCWGQAFVSWNSTAGSLTSTTRSDTFLDVSGNGTLTANFATGFNVTFTETGLTGGNSWTVAMNGTTLTGTLYTIVFEEPNGTFYYQIPNVPGYSKIHPGFVTIDGANTTVQIKFRSLSISVRFQETGLPDETVWSVTLNHTQDNAISSWIAFGETNGTYSYSIGSVAGYSSNVTSGTVSVAGSPLTIMVSFTSGAGGSSGTPAGLWYGLAAVALVAVVAGLVFVLSRRRWKRD